MKTVPSNVTKTYPQRGPLSQFRFADSTAFWCFRCGATVSNASKDGTRWTVDQMLEAASNEVK